MGMVVDLREVSENPEDKIKQLQNKNKIMYLGKG